MKMAKKLFIMNTSQSQFQGSIILNKNPIHIKLFEFALKRYIYMQNNRAQAEPGTFKTFALEPGTLMLFIENICMKIIACEPGTFLDKFRLKALSLQLAAAIFLLKYSLEPRIIFMKKNIKREKAIKKVKLPYVSKDESNPRQKQITDQENNSHRTK